MWTQSCPIWGGGTQPSLPLAVSPSALVPAALPSSEVDGKSKQFVPVPDIAAALVAATSLKRPVLSSRWLPPTQNFCRGGFQRQLQPCWHEQPHLVARWCRHLRLPQRHLMLPPSIPSHLMTEIFFPSGEGMPIQSCARTFSSSMEANTT